MTAKEYLSQAHRLNEKIDTDIEELERLRAMLTNIGSPISDSGSHSTPGNDAHFVKCTERILELEEKIDAEIDLFVDLKDKILHAIGTVADPDRQAVLRLRYLSNLSFGEIGVRMHIGVRTARRWHISALEHIVIPED